MRVARYLYHLLFVIFNPAFSQVSNILMIFSEYPKIPSYLSHSSNSIFPSIHPLLIFLFYLFCGQIVYFCIRFNQHIHFRFHSLFLPWKLFVIFSSEPFQEFINLHVQLHSCFSDLFNDIFYHASSFGECCHSPFDINISRIFSINLG